MGWTARSRRRSPSNDEKRIRTRRNYRAAAQTQTHAASGGRLMPQELYTQPLPDEAADYAEEELNRKIESGNKLDSLISGAQDEAEKPDEFEDFVSARQHRQELAERHGTDAAGIVDKFSYYNTELKKHGEIGAELIRGDYLSNTNLQTLLHVAEKQKADSETKTGKADNAEDVHWFAKLDKIVEGSIDETDERAKDQAEFATAKEKFAALKIDNPNLSWKTFFEVTAHTDRELWRDPNFANRLAAASGVPVTALQGETAKVHAQQQQELGAIGGLMDEMEKRGELLSLERYAPQMAKLWTRPDFVKTGDTRQDLRRANRIVELLELDRLQNLERQNAVQKAHRAAPVKSSGGMRTAAVRSGSLDQILTSATAHLSDD
jgi:hypothetical protein